MYESDATDPVGAYDELTLISAEQTGKNEITLTTSAPVDALDEIEVFKGTKEVDIDSIIYGEEEGAVVTLKNAIVADAEYTVTLTPADGEATSATFTGEKASVGEIVFLNNYLVMKDSSYSEGYAFVKGYDQFGNEISLTGLTVTPGVGKFKSFDASTGKITIESGVADDQTSPFMTIKQVPIFVQFQNGTDVITKQESLEVSTMGYLADMEFGEIKKDGTPREDGLLTITELGSKKYYIEILDAQDQYGNPLTADDLNTQKDGDAKGNKTLFVIPGDTGAFFTTGQFAELKGQTILWLNEADPSRPTMPTAPLTITGAGGAFFSTDVVISDDPYIAQLNVTYPQLNVNVAESDEFEWSAVDQYGDEVDMYDFKPEVDATGKKLTFDDMNHLTNRQTEVSLSGNARFNEVSYDAGARTFKVTVGTDVTLINDAAKKGDMISYVVTTASMDVATHQTSVGGEGTAAKIKTDGTSNQLVGNGLGGSATYDFNNKITFEDANGQIMKRTDADWPVYSDVTGIAQTIDHDGDASTAPVTGLLLTAPNNYQPTDYYWTLAKSKVTNGVLVQAGTNGVYNVNEMIDATTGLNVATKDVYVVLWAKDGGGQEVLLDQKPFHFTQVVGTEKKYTASCSDTLYVQKRDDGYKDNVEVKVTAITDKGESYSVPANRIKLGAKIPFNTTNNKIYGDYDLDEKGSFVATVFVEKPDGSAWEEATSVTINYTNEDPVPTKFSYSFKATNGGSQALSTFGTNPDVDAPTEFTLTGTAVDGPAATIVDGKLTITDANKFGDTLTAKIVDQYGQDITNTVFKTNGTEIVDGTDLVEGKNVVEYAAGKVNGRFTLNNKSDAAIPVGVTKTIVTQKVKTAKQLEDALEAASTATEPVQIQIDNTTINYDKDMYIGSAVDLIIPNGYTLNVTGSVTNDGVIRGTAAAGLNTPTTAGTLKINGVSGSTTLGGDTATYDLPGSSLELTDVEVTGTMIFRGNLKISGNVVFDENSGVKIVNGSTIDFAADSKLTVEKKVTVVGDLDTAAAVEADAVNLTVTVDGAATASSADIVTALQDDSKVVAIPEGPEEGDPITCTPTAYEILPDLVALDKGLDELDAKDSYDFNDLTNLEDEYTAAIAALAKVPGDDVEPKMDTMNDLVKLAKDQDLFGMYGTDKNYDDLKKAIEDSVPGLADELLNTATTALNGAVTAYLKSTTGGTTDISTLISQYSDYPADYEALLTALGVEHTEPTTEEAKFTAAFEGASEVVELAAITTPLFTVAQNEASATATVALADDSELRVDIGASLDAKVNVTKNENDGTLIVTPKDNAQAGNTTNVTITISGKHYKRFINYVATINSSDATKLASVNADSTGGISQNQS